MVKASRSVTFAMTGAVHANGRAVRQIRLLQELCDPVHVIASEVDGATGLFADNVRLHEYQMPASSGWRFFLTLHRRVRSVAAQIETDIYHASDLYVLPALAGLASRRLSILVYDARELYPFVQGTAGRPWATWFWSEIEGRFAAKAHLIMTVNDSIADRIADAYGVKRPLVIPNVPVHHSVSRSDYLRENVPASDSDLLVLHLGQMKRGRGCATLIRAIAVTEGVHGVFLGHGTEQSNLQRLASAEGIADRVTFLAPVPYDRVVDAAAGAGVGVSLLEDTCLNHRLALPNKLFEYLAAGLPVIASDFPELRRVVEGYNVGLLVNPSDARSVSQAIETIRDDPKLRRSLSQNTLSVGEDYNWTVVSERMREGYLNLPRGV